MLTVSPASAWCQDTLVAIPSLPVLGDALERQKSDDEIFSEAVISPLSTSGVPADNTGGWSIDTSNRQVSRNFYNSVYSASEFTPDGWVGDVGNCVAGDTSSDFKNSVLARINYFRAMAGVPSDVMFSATYNSKSQQAALMMSRNNTLNHTPPDTWDCYTAEGAEAAGSSNLSLGHYGWDAVSGQMRDDGSNNGPVGHRRWLLYPQTQTMGTGDIPSDSGYLAANSIWVFDDNMWEARPATRDDFVAWPPPGYVPYQIVPDRWSFSYPGADFSSAAVSMTCDGSALTITLETLASNMGENTLVWYQSNPWQKPVTDLSCVVYITGISNTPSSEYTYGVTIIDPFTVVGQEEFPEISGSQTAFVGQTGTWSYTEVSFAEEYEVLQGTLLPPLPEGAETGPGTTLDYTDVAYDLITTDAAATGTHSFHLAQPQPQTNSFEIDISFVPTGTSNLTFNSQLGYATADQLAIVQISQDDGLNWSTLFSQSGTDDSGESVFQQHTISLSAYSDRLIRLRVSYGFEDGQSGSYYFCTSASCGFLIDDISISDSKQVQNRVTSLISTGTSFNFTPDLPETYILSARTIGWPGYPGLEWSSVFYVNAADSFPWTMFLPAVTGNNQ